MKHPWKAVFSICLIFAVTAALAPAVCLSALASPWNGGMTAPATNAEGYYLIDSGEKLAWFSNQVNTGHKSIKAKQSADLDMASRAFTPIGTSTYPFLGIYDGGGHTITNLKVSVTTDNAGLFGVIGATTTTTTLYDDYGDAYTETVSVPSEVNNVVVENANISGAKNVGGIVGYSEGGAVSGCSVAGTVTGTGSNVGGVVGYNYKSASVLNCLNTASVSGTLRVGGIAGYCLASATVDGCCNMGTVSASSYVGGIVGTSSGSEAAHSYNKGAVSAVENACGGLIGYAAYGEIYCMYALGTVTCPGEYTGIAIGNAFYGTGIERVYYDRDNSTMTDSFATAAEHELMLDASFLVTLNFGKDIFVGDYFNANNGYPLLRWQLAGWDGSLGEPETDASGTYLITNGSELAWFAALVNGSLSGTTQNTAAKGKVTRDILLNPGIFDENSIAWTPIGSVSSPFIGTFDGGEYRISGIYIHDTSLNNQGLFGKIGEGGVVKNLFIESSSITAYENVGAVAGSNFGTIQNCFNYSAIRSTYNTGGVSGSNNGTIQNCGNSGSVYGTYSAGGVVGINNDGMITSCFNMDRVYSLQRTGGIIGTNYGVIRYCYNNGEVEGGVSVGGLVGYQNSSVANNFSSCYNIGRIKGASQVGAVVGYFINGVVTYCYYDTERSGVSDTVATGKTTEEMAGGSLASFSGFSYSYWIVRVSDTYFSYCPELRVFYNSTNTLLKNTSKNSAAVLKKQYTVMAQVDGELPTYYSSLATGSAHIGWGEGTLVQLRDAEVSAAAQINGRVTVTDDGQLRTLTRAASFTGSFFLVSGKLTLDGAGTDTLVMNGGKDLGSSVTGAPLINVDVTGTVTLEDGVVLTKNRTEDNGSAVFLDGGALQMNGGKLTANTAKYGGAVYCVGGSVTTTGGTISGNTATNGGAIFFEGRTASSSLDALTITGNSAGYGGAIYNRNSTVSILGGTITNNTATSAGGAIYNTGTVACSGGSISGNTAPTAAGVYQNGTLQMAGTISLGESDDIYLLSGKRVTNTARITTGGIVAYLTAADYAAGTRVLDGDACAANYAKYVMNVPSGQPELNINSTGYLVAKEIHNVAMVSKFGAYDVYFTSLKEAVDSIAAEETGLVTMIADDTIEETIQVKGNVTVTILGDEESNRTLTRFRTCTGSMFSVQAGGVLEFGAPGAQNDASLIVDGGRNLYGQYGGSIVSNAGTLRLRDGATLCNAYVSGNGAAVTNTGTMEISGGSITNCAAANGGAVYSSGTVQMTGGSISDCTADKGGAIWSSGTLTIQSGTISGNSAPSGGAVYVSGGEASLQGGTITGNTATNGGGVYVGSGTWSLPGGTVTVITTEGGESNFTEQDVTVTLTGNSATENGGAVYAAGGTGSFSAGAVNANTAKRGGGFHLANGAVCTISTGTMQNNTATGYGGAVYDAGSLTLQNASIDASNDVYIASGKTLIPAGSSVSAVLTPYTYTIGTQLLSGSAVASLYGGFAVSNDRYFIDAEGKLRTNTIAVKESSPMSVDYAENLILGVDTAHVDVSTVLTHFDNAAANLTVTNEAGVVQSGTAPVRTGYVLTLKNGSGTVLDVKTFVIVGDIDGDGDMDGEDAVMAYAFAAGKLTKANSGAARYRAADANNSGSIDSADGELLRACGLYKNTVSQP